ncbi:tRNA pseudouridine synthase B [Hyella patelloides LEGE 07179]|uniref:tRNA pseudouridine synthase B n=1 Tax=Hyella patelloides LEGE 07179 TaxID=945734 RepID=A0A563VQE6_9CYAN|nr:tRNA pseudouridine(55) synthase TruB [Hyella patelloides]VEP13653.1 tRNA pseudouridine synthase B [Hyella patelloides LEGE 07179]
MFGFLNLNKPQGFTSHDCVAKTRRLINMKKVGHGGTLDPEATGVLPIAVGKATRLLQFLPEKKAYRARIRLGMQTTTDDLEGEVVATKPVNNLQKEELIQYLSKFNGEIEQVPPIYSAIKQKGKKLYELARKGIEVEVPKRKVTIYSCELINLVTGEFPEVEVDISCSAGTYIRAIARDLGAMLGVGGTLANLIRTESCNMQLKDSINFETIEEQLQNNTFKLIRPDLILAHLTTITLDLEQSKRWCHGQTICLPDKKSISVYDYEINQENLATLEQPVHSRVYQEDSRFLGIGVLKSQEGILSSKPKIVCANLDIED